MAKLPKKVKVSCFDITIEQISNLEAIVTNRWGDFSPDNHRIRLEHPFEHPQQHVDALLHEVLHAIWWSYKLEDTDKEERVVSTVATALTQVLRDNPKLLEFIKETLEGG